MQICLSIVGVCASWFKAIVGESILTVLQSACGSIFSSCVGACGGIFGGMCGGAEVYIESAIAQLISLLQPK